MKDLLAFFYTESPLHAGASDSEGIIDLPIQREAHTRYPTVYGQSLKGALRQAAKEHEEWSDRDVTAVFGSPVGQGGPTTPGLLSVGDAQLVALPVPTLRKNFAWVTSVMALGRLARKYWSLTNSEGPALPTEPGEALSPGTAGSATSRSPRPGCGWHPFRHPEPAAQGVGRKDPCRCLRLGGRLRSFRR